MKFYSEVTKKLYDSEDELKSAETSLVAKKKAEEEAALKLKEERKARSKDVEDARKAYIDAKKNYYNVLDKFCKDYGSYHASYKTDDIDSIFEDFFDLFY